MVAASVRTRARLRLILKQDTGTFLSLQVNDWSDSSIFRDAGR